MIKDHLQPNSVLIRKNNLYFFEKGVQMKGKANKTLFDKCFLKTCENDSSLLPQRTRKLDSLKGDHTPTNLYFLDSIFSNSPLNKEQTTPKDLTLNKLKVKANYQDLNKFIKERHKNKPKERAFNMDPGHENNPLVIFLFILLFISWVVYSKRWTTYRIV